MSICVAVGPVIPNTLGDALNLYFQGGDYGPLMRELQILIPIPISGVLLYGSLAEQKIPSVIGESDVDLLVLVDEAAHGGVFGCSIEIQIDLHVQKRQTTLKDLEDNWHYSDARIIWDASPPELLLWQQELKNWKDYNLPSWDDADLLRNLVWAKRLIGRIKRVMPQNMALARLHLSRLVSVIPIFHAHLRGVHTTSFSQWWKQLIETDPIFHTSLNSFLTSPDISIEQLHNLIAVLFNARQRVCESQKELLEVFKE